MAKLRLNIGALTVSDMNGGSYSFLLRKDKDSKFLNIKLSRSEANAIVAVLGYKRGVPPLQMVFSSNLQNFGVRLSEVNIIVIGRKKEYAAELVFQSAETESRSVATFADGITLARLCNAPLMIDEALFEKFAVKTDSAEKKIQTALREALENENYELAADLDGEIRRLLEDLEEGLTRGKGAKTKKTVKRKPKNTSDEK
ncbi:MAG: bifunctional nuclease domain-containing protein [Candidatus Egerieousia sp.]